MKRILTLMLSVVLSVCTFAQTEAIDIMQEIISNPDDYISASVNTTEVGGVEKARRIAKSRLIDAVLTRMSEEISDEAIASATKELTLKKINGESVLVLYIKKSDLQNTPANPNTPEPDPLLPIKNREKPAVVKDISFHFTGESYTNVSKDTMEKNISRLLCAINDAYTNGTEVNVSGINMTDDCRQSLLMGWKHKPYFCIEAENVKPCLHASENQTVRDIPVYSEKDEDHFRNISIAFNKQGQIECVRFAADLASYDKIMRNGGKEITDAVDAARRTSILSFVENYRNYYINMDINKIEQVFADDAIIITGSVIKTLKRKKGDNNKVYMDPKVVYHQQKKEEYIKSLRGLFARNKEINVLFDEIKVIQDPAKKDFYGVTLKQQWDSKSKAGGSYSDVGYVFLLWDFQNPEQPKIHVRTWQPKEVIKREEDILGLNSFKY